MIVGGIRLITYDSAVTLKSGPHGVSVVAAPPVVVAGLEHHGAQPGAGEVGRGDEAVVPAADDDARRTRRACSTWLGDASDLLSLSDAGTITALLN